MAPQTTLPHHIHHGGLLRLHKWQKETVEVQLRRRRSKPILSVIVLLLIASSFRGRGVIDGLGVVSWFRLRWTAAGVSRMSTVWPGMGLGRLNFCTCMYIIILPQHLNKEILDLQVSRPVECRPRAKILNMSEQIYVKFRSVKLFIGIRPQV
jgi:hypothetical protein